MPFIMFLIFGLIVGALARLLFPGPQKMGWIATLLLGMAGAFLGGWLGQVFGLTSSTDPVGFFLSIVGAAILLWVVQLIRNRNLR